MKGRKQDRIANPEKVREREKKQRNKQIKASKKGYNQIEIDCEFCECKVKKCRWKAHTETQKHKKNKMTKREEENKVSKMSDEEKE